MCVMHSNLQVKFGSPRLVNSTTKKLLLILFFKNICSLKERILSNTMEL